MITLAFGIGLWLLFSTGNVTAMTDAGLLWIMAMVCDVGCVAILAAVYHAKKK